MSTPFYDLASLVVVPSGYKASKVYAQKPLTTDGQLTFSRASTATRVASNGLIEKVRTNLILQSNTFSTTWANSDSTETGGQAGYDGTNNAWLLTTTLSGGFIFQSVAINGQTTFSVYAKAGSQNGLILYSVHVAQGRNFNLSTGTVGGAFVAAPESSQIQSVGNGWYRCSITVTSSSTNNFRIYVGDGSSTALGNVVIQNAQGESGDVATAYIPTTTAAVSVGPVANVPRLDYLNSSCPRLLLEPQRTNLFTYNSAFDNAAWTKNESTISANAATSPDGTSNADKMVPSVNSGAQYITQDLSITSGTTYTQTIYAKADGYSFVQMTGSISFPGNYANFNLANGTLGSTDGGTATITSVGNGWYRLTYTLTAIATTTGRIIVALVSSASSGRLNSFAGNGTSGVLLYGAQLEVGAYPTSLIPTTTAAVTRLADDLRKTGISSLIGQTEGVWYLDFTFINNGATYQAFMLSDGTSSNLVYMYRAGTSNFAFYVNGQSIGTFAGANNTRYKIAFAYKAGQHAVYINGTQVFTSTISVAPTALSQLNADYLNTGIERLQSPIHQILLFKTRLTNAQLAELTTL